MAMRGFKLNTQPLQLLTREQVEAIHQGTLKVLSETGSRIEHQEALELLSEHGCQVDFQKKQVRIP